MDERESELDLYGAIYRCESCSGLSDPNGVAPFVRVSSAQTIPVSHFGDIRTSLMWVVFNNPKGDRTDSNVGTTPSNYHAARRSDLSDNAVTAIKTRFDCYFNAAVSSHLFFKTWRTMLNGLDLGDGPVSFENGGICAVDLIKCPTQSGWRGFVVRPEGKQVWSNCLRDPKANQFLLRQIDFHAPRIIVFAGTQKCVPAFWKGNKDRDLSTFAAKSRSDLLQGVWTVQSPTRLSIGLKGQRQVESLTAAQLAAERQVIQDLIARWCTATRPFPPTHS